MNTTSLLARCIRGLEWIVAAEIEGRNLGTVTSIAHRQVRFVSEGLPSRPALELQTADDVFLICGEISGLDHTRASLAMLTDAGRRLDLAQCLSLRDQIVGTSLNQPMTVVASFLGRRNYNRFEIEDALALGMATHVPHRYLSSRTLVEGQPVISVRAHLEEDRALFALRIFDRPLHRRSHRRSTHPGALHPPLAAALALLAGLRPAGRLLDPFCGVATIPLEALSLQSHLVCSGSEIASERLAAAVRNFADARLPANLAQASAAALPFAAGTFDRIVSNPPWGHAVASVGDALMERFAAEAARVLRPDGRVTLLVHGQDADPLLWARHGFERCFRARVSLFGLHPEIWILSSEAAASPFDTAGLLGSNLVRSSALADSLAG